MLPKGRRISRRVFPAHTVTKVVWSGEVLRAHCFLRKETTETRFSVVVAKKYYSNIAERNLYKRRVYTAIQSHISEFDRSRFSKFIFFPKMKISDVRRIIILKDIRSLITSFNS